MRKKILVVVLLLVILFKTNTVNAIVISSCKTTTLSNLKSIANNINLSYTYEIKNNNAYFKVTINNLINDIYIVDSLGNKYIYNNSNNGEITTKEYYNVEKIKFYIYSNVNDCMNDLLLTKYINLPIYNIYFNDPLCNGIENYKLCQKWYNQTLSYEEFVYEINKYKSIDEIDTTKEINRKDVEGLFDIMFNIYIKYYYIILPILIVSCLIIMYIKNKKNKFNL